MVSANTYNKNMLYGVMKCFCGPYFEGEYLYGLLKIKN